MVQRTASRLRELDRPKARTTNCRRGCLFPERRPRHLLSGEDVIGLSMYERGDMMATMKDAGASDYLTKSEGMEEVISTILRHCPRLVYPPPGHQPDLNQDREGQPSPFLAFVGPCPTDEGLFVA